MQILHYSLLVKAIFLSMKWKYLCLKTFKMGIYALEFMHFLIEKVSSGQFCIVKYYILKFSPFSLSAEDLASK